MAERMSKSRLMEIMRQNDAPLGGAIFAWLGKIGAIEEGRAKPTIVDDFMRDYEMIMRIYRKVDMVVQREETGRSILIKTRALLEELPLLFISYAQDETMLGKKLPEDARIREVFKELNKCVIAYKELPAYHQYREAHTDYVGITRTEWFDRGKPANKTNSV